MYSYRINLLLVLLVCLFVSLPLRAGAQSTASPSSVPVDLTVSSTLRKDQATESISQLRELYKSQVEVYRSSAQQYSIAKEQYANLQTLAALEEAVRATREALLNRSRLLVTYFQLLRITITDVPGIELTQKQQVLSRLDSMESRLVQHQDAILNTETRAGIGDRANEFAALEKEMESTIYQALAILSVGKVQTVYDQAMIIRQDIETYHQTATASSLIQAERARAHTETKRNFAELQTELGSVLTRLAEQAEKVNSFNKSSYERTLEDLESNHIRLTQVISYLSELARL